MSSDDWNDLAVRVAQHVEDFLAGLDAVAAGEGRGEVVPVLLLEVSQICLAGAQLGASEDVILVDNKEPAIGEMPDIDALRQGLGRRLEALDEYAEVFDPYGDNTVTPYRLSDDLADIAVDLVHGLSHYKADRPLEALWWWQFSYFNHWGNHAGAALRALQAVVAHTRLDVPEESVGV